MHFVLRFSDIQPVAQWEDTKFNKILFATLLGSDIKRAALGLKGLILGRKRPEFLFLPKTTDTITELL